MHHIRRVVRSRSRSHRRRRRRSRRSHRRHHRRRRRSRVYCYSGRETLKDRIKASGSYYAVFVAPSSDHVSSPRAHASTTNE
jgi:hypothetical protein